MKIDEIIKNENENTNLDFKAVEYNKSNRQSLLKDFVAMANAKNQEPKYIIIGVKDIPGLIEKRKIIGIDNISDQADLENIIQENIEPTINFRYFAYEIEEKKIGVIEIYNNLNPPYMMKKKYGNLSVGDMWIRKGSRQSRVTRRDLDYYNKLTINSISNNDVLLGFNDNLDLKIELKRIKIDFETEMPSQKKKVEYQNKLEKLKKFKSGELIEDNKPLISIFNEYDEKNGEITMFKGEMGIPVRWNQKEIEDNINVIDTTYFEEDFYYIFEEKSSRINFYLLNQSSEFLEDVKVSFYFQSEDFLIAEEKPKKPQNTPLYSVPSLSNNFNPFINYPIVRKKKDLIIVEEFLKTIRHKELTPLFKEKLRILNINNINLTESIIKYKISAKNLANPIEGDLTIVWKD